MYYINTLSVKGVRGRGMTQENKICRVASSVKRCLEQGSKWLEPVEYSWDLPPLLSYYLLPLLLFVPAAKIVFTNIFQFLEVFRNSTHLSSIIAVLRSFQGLFSSACFASFVSSTFLATCKKNFNASYLYSTSSLSAWLYSDVLYQNTKSWQMAKGSISPSSKVPRLVSAPASTPWAWPSWAAPPRPPSSCRCSPRLHSFASSPALGSSSCSSSSSRSPLPHSSWSRSSTSWVAFDIEANR